MIITANSLTTLQDCQRKFCLDHLYKPVRWNPKLLHDALLRRAVLELSRNVSLDEVAGNARAQYLQSATEPGLEVDGPPYPIAREWVTLLEVLVYSLPRIGIPPGLHESPVVDLSSTTQWRLSSFTDSLGNFHRYITVDRWTHQRMIEEIHSWYVAGDMAVLGRTLTIHAIEIGQMKENKRQSLWVRGYKHPSLLHLQRVRFKHKDGSPFKNWTPVRLVDLRNADTEEWVEQLWQDGAGGDLIHTAQIHPPDTDKSEAVLQDIHAEGVRMQHLIDVGDWKHLPMSRGSCDGHYPCQFQDVCYSGANPETSGFFVKRIPSGLSDSCKP